jgi:hypothetical protein
MRIAVPQKERDPGSNTLLPSPGLLIKGLVSGHPGHYTCPEVVDVRATLAGIQLLDTGHRGRRTRRVSNAQSPQLLRQHLKSS